MPVYVDSLEEWGWVMRCRKVASCHMFTDEIDLGALHEIAQRIGMQRRWFQNKRTAPHYDLVAGRRAAAVALGAIEVDRREASRIWKMRREAVAMLAAGSNQHLKPPNWIGSNLNECR